MAYRASMKKMPDHHKLGHSKTVKRLVALLIGIVVAVGVAAEPSEQVYAAINAAEYSKAATLLAKGAASGDAESQFVLGNLLSEGLVPDADTKTGVVWLEKAVKNRHRDAALTLSKMYLSGFNVPLDTEKGTRYMALANEFSEDDDDDGCD